VNYRNLIVTIVKGVVGVFLTLTSIVVACNVWVVNATKDKIYYSIDKLPAHKVALILGTSKFSRSGKTNLFFKTRIDAATDIYKNYKAAYFIASGDNSLSYYNEPQDMKKALISRGIPEERITLDYAGFRTFDSVVRSKKVFSQDSVIIITQDFHCYRALFISQFYGMHPVAFATGGVPEGHSVNTLLREYLARCKAVIDLYILRKKPRFLGQTINIEAGNNYLK
jgi:SanA protein